MGIMVVDDSELDQQVIRSLLENVGYTDICTVSSADDAIKTLEKNKSGKKSPIDLILMDVEMPGISGFEACRLIKSTGDFKDIPIIIVTGKTDLSSIRLAISSGANDYILKPIKVFDLMPKVYSALKLKNETDTRKAKEQELLKANRLLDLERKKTENLLHTLLPTKIVWELQQYGRTRPRLFRHVSVLFTDIVQFTKVCSLMSPELLIRELNELFSSFDAIVEKHDCERIKTIGDAYLAVCGMPEENKHHAENIIKAALGIADYMQARNAEKAVKWEIRLGIHSGEVVGSIVGVKRYIYDIFGDAVNTASRMESNADPMRVNISEATHALVKDKFECEERPPLAIKGKGAMKMYYVKGEALNASEDGMVTLSDIIGKG